MAAFAWDTSGSIHVNAQQGGSGAPVGSGFTDIYSSMWAFAALHESGSIHAWGTSRRWMPSATASEPMLSTSPAFSTWDAIAGVGHAIHRRSITAERAAASSRHIRMCCFAAVGARVTEIHVWPGSSYYYDVVSSNPPTGPGYTIASLSYSDAARRRVPAAAGASAAFASVFANRAELKAAVDEWLADATAAEAVHGPLPEWDMSRVDDLSQLSAIGHLRLQRRYLKVGHEQGDDGDLLRRRAFNQPLDWDMSSVTDMHYTFAYATSFNQQLIWDTSKVAYMHGPVQRRLRLQPAARLGRERGDVHVRHVPRASVFNQSLDWDTSKVTYLENTFTNADAFNSQLAWDTSQDDMEKTFMRPRRRRLVRSCCHSAVASTNRQAPAWDVAKASRMDAMFDGTALASDELERSVSPPSREYSRWSRAVCPPPPSPPPPPGTPPGYILVRPSSSRSGTNGQ